MHLHASRIALDIDGIPYITYGIIVICLLFQYLISSNHDKIELSAKNYCNTIHNVGNAEDPLVHDLIVCHEILLARHHRKLIDSLEPDKGKDKLDTTSEMVSRHYRAFFLNTSQSVQAVMAYDTSSWNPITMLFSNFAHRDWQHVFANMSLLLAFASIIELLSLNRLLFLIGVLTFALVTGISSSIAAWIIGERHFIMGMTGVVIGMMGMAAYLIPQAKLRAQFGKLYFLPVWLPVWVYIACFLSWDFLYIGDHSYMGEASISGHLVSLLLGYFLGYKLFGHRKNDIQEELKEVMAYQKSRRQDHFGALNSYIGDTQRQLEEINSQQRKRQWATFEGRLRNLVNVYEDAQVMALLLENHDFYVESVEIYQDLFEEVGKWRKGKAYLCIGRLIIGILLLEKKYALAIIYANKCLQYAPDFLPASPDELLLLVKNANVQQEYELAGVLLENAKQSYGLENFVLMKDKLSVL